MISITILIKRLPHLTHDQFSTYWRDSHAPLVASVPTFMRHVVSYTQHHTADLPSLEAMFGGKRDYDGVALLTFRSEDDIRAAFAEPDYLSRIRPDELTFVDVDACIVVVSDVNTVV